VRRRRSAGVAVRALEILLSNRPRTPAHQRLAWRVATQCTSNLRQRGYRCHAAIRSLLRGSLGDAKVSLEAYRRHCKGLKGAERAHVRALAAACYGMSQTHQPGTARAHARAALRAERRARGLRLVAVAGIARAFRRRVASSSRREDITVAMLRALRTLVLCRAPVGLWRIADDLRQNRQEAGLLARCRARLIIDLIHRWGHGVAVRPLRLLDLGLWRTMDSKALLAAGATRRTSASWALRNNRFLHAGLGASQDADIGRRVASLGIVAGPVPRELLRDPKVYNDWPLVVAWERLTRHLNPPDGDGLGSRAPRDALLAQFCRRVWQGSALSLRERRYLVRASRDHVAWSSVLVLAVTAATATCRAGDVRQGARVCARGGEAYRGFRRLCRQQGVTRQPALLDEYEAMCRRVLAAFEPPIGPGVDPVRTIARVARGLPRGRPTRPGRVIDALDAVITAGHSGHGVEIEARVVRHLAQMLRGRVLFHYVKGQYPTLRPQAEHTLSTWTVRRLARADRVVAHVVRPRPEFWRPEQRRPGALLAFPIGEGAACVARRRPFARREIRAVRAVLRFLAARRTGDHLLPAPRRPGEPQPPPRALAGEGLIGRSRPWRKVLAEVGRVAQSDCPVVLLGETGTGKERLARAIHSSSARSQGPFVPVNCGAISPDLIASELFGHIRGAFTGAHRTRSGMILQAHRGTLFLDEVADMPPAMQVALLRVLEDRLVVPVGGERPRNVNVRLVSATHKGLHAEVEAGRFREDLYHRLAVIEIALPPLRERGEDLEILAAHLLARTSEQKTLHPDSLPVLARHSWPGNVRELDNVLRAASLLVDGPEVTPEILERILQARRSSPPPAQTQAPRLGPRTDALLRILGERWWAAPDLAGAMGVSSRTVNRELVGLLAKGLVMAHGEARARRYRRASEGAR
jgi:transcriptional regulator with AAA-type ATPase domain